MKKKELTSGKLRRLEEFRNGGTTGDPGLNDDSSESDKPGYNIAGCIKERKCIGCRYLKETESTDYYTDQNNEMCDIDIINYYCEHSDLLSTRKITDSREMYRIQIKNDKKDVRKPDWCPLNM